ncbi:hypothetical protein [Paraglaciecola sp.]|uniref:hypothetical protein n=1 Tax=Paraglaciecola sp. TaxID=1920173 RepID=UPI003EF89DEF
MFKGYSIILPALLLCYSLQNNLAWAKADTVTFLGLGITQDVYHSELLVEVFNHAPNKDFVVKQYKNELPHHRGFMFLAENRDIDIMIGYATEERDKHFRAIPIPISKGLNGWRLSAVHKDNVDVFKNINTLQEFKKFSPGQFHSWTDLKILLANDITPTPGSDFLGLYVMLHKKRFDYLPRSIAELNREIGPIRKDHNLNIVVEPHILIVYPTAFYFYVNKENTELAESIRLGLENIIANGVFDRVFYKHHSEALKQIERESRRIFRLDNPLLPKSVPLSRKELWLNAE